METLIEGVVGLGSEPGRIVMMFIGGLLMYLGIKKEYEPTLLVPMGLGTLLVNFPNSGVLSAGGEAGPFQVLFDMGISTELFP
ncbi:sodium ion-translocating decarboxylase subunit beta, partial [Listeria monocytogenes]|nr:sodium ion-translocating decarboxylase subunit beta [Listeria monocytogenes]